MTGTGTMTSGDALTTGGALLIVGDVVTDVVARYRSPLAYGTDTVAEIRTLPGGAGANAACWAVRTGCADVRILARVGAGDRDWHEERLRRSGVRARLVVDETAPTATVISLVDTSAERTFLTDNGAALRLCPADWSPSLLDGVGRLHLSGYLFFSDTSRRLSAAVLESARERGIPVSVDPASTGFLADLGTRTFLTAAGGVDTLLPNADEARLLAGRQDVAEAAAELSRGIPLVVVTLGAEGALVARAGAVTARVAAARVDALDTTGAGDAFTGAFLAALLAGADPASAAEEGCRAGTLSVTLTGGRPPEHDGEPPVSQPEPPQAGRSG